MTSFLSAAWGKKFGFSNSILLSINNQSASQFHILFRDKSHEVSKAPFLIRMQAMRAIVSNYIRKQISVLIISNMRNGCARVGQRFASQHTRLIINIPNKDDPVAPTGSQNIISTRMEFHSI